MYDKICKKSDDYFNYGGGSEFVKHPLEIQMSRIKNGLKKFEDEKIKIRAFSPWPGTWFEYKGEKIKVLAGRTENVFSSKNKKDSLEKSSRSPL